MAVQKYPLNQTPLSEMKHTVFNFAFKDHYAVQLSIQIALVSSSLLTLAKITDILIASLSAQGKYGGSEIPSIRSALPSIPSITCFIIFMHGKSKHVIVAWWCILASKPQNK